MKDGYLLYFLKFGKERSGTSILRSGILKPEASLITGNSDHGEINAVKESMGVDTPTVRLLGCHQAEQLQAAQVAHNRFAVGDNVLIRRSKSRNVSTLTPKWGVHFLTCA